MSFWQVVHKRFRVDSSKDTTSGFSSFIGNDVWYLQPLAPGEDPWQSWERKDTEGDGDNIGYQFLDWIDNQDTYL